MTGARYRRPASVAAMETTAADGSPVVFVYLLPDGPAAELESLGRARSGWGGGEPLRRGHRAPGGTPVRRPGRRHRRRRDRVRGRARPARAAGPARPGVLTSPVALGRGGWVQRASRATTVATTALDASRPRSLHVAQGDGAVGELVAADDEYEGPSRAAGRLHLGLHGPIVVGPLGGDARPAQLDREVAGGVTSGGVDHEAVDPRLVGAPNTPSASQVSSTRSMPQPKPMPGVGGPPSCSMRPS